MPTQAKREKALQVVEKLGDQLATALEEEVLAGAVADWFATGLYHSPASVYVTDCVPDLQQLGLDRSNAPHYPVRALIAGIITATFEEPTS